MNNNATIDEIKALNEIHRFIWGVKTGEIDTIMPTKTLYLYQQYKKVYDRFVIMDKEIGDLTQAEQNQPSSLVKSARNLYTADLIPKELYEKLLVTLLNKEDKE